MALRSFDDATSDESRQFLLDRRDERKHPKRHRTNKRAKGLLKRRRNKVRAHLARRDAAHRKFLVAARLYWAGEADGHPTL